MSMRSRTSSASVDLRTADNLILISKFMVQRVVGKLDNFFLDDDDELDEVSQESNTWTQDCYNFEDI